MTQDLRPIERFRALIGGPPLPEAFDVATRRTAMEAMASRLGPPADIVHAPATIAGIPCEWVTAPGSRDSHVVVWTHGGGFCAGSCHTHRGIAGEIARHAGARVVTIDYRLSPENPYPAGQDDCNAVYAQVSAMPGISKIAIVGDSAGGALALSVALAAPGTARAADALVLYSPWLDLRCEANSFTSRAGHDPMIHPQVLCQLGIEYRADRAVDDPAVSPGLADLAGLPPTLVQVGADEVLLDDSLMFDQRARAAGVDVTLEVWAEMVHVFQAYHMLIPEGASALARTGRFLRAKWGH